MALERGLSQDESDKNLFYLNKKFVCHLFKGMLGDKCEQLSGDIQVLEAA
jgi:hypothetical protein